MFSAARYAGQSNDSQKKTMPGGIGPVSIETISACAGRDRRIASAKNPNEIFFNLDNRRVFYDSAEGHLYFVDSPDGIVMQTVSASLAGLQHPPSIEQVYLDPHKCFHGARRVKLGEADANTLLIALRLTGIRTTIR